MGITFLLVFQLFPQFFGGRPGAGATPTPADALATATPAATPGPATPESDPRTYYWNLVLVHPLEAGLRFLASDLGLGAGTAIILFTIMVRLVLLPLSIQQIRSQKAMQRLQPELKALQKRLGSDKEKLSVETMALYKEHGVNPAAGCFPIVLQMPVLFGLYGALNNLGTQLLPENEPFHQPWLWIAHLNQPDIIHIPGVPFPLPFILPILAALTQWVQQRMMTQPSDDPQQQMQNQIFQFMPLMMLYFGLNFQAGLALYWVTQNIIGIVQQYFSTGLGGLAPYVERLRGRRAGSVLAVRSAGESAPGAVRDRSNGRARGGENRTGTGRRTRGKR
jgi:YidC/Oxa1 family membrane protein insertase